MGANNQRITKSQKEAAIAALREHGTMQYAAKVSGVCVRTLNEEMRRSEIFKARVLEARTEGKQNIADKAISLIRAYALGENPDGTSVVVKTDRNRLTAAIALANAYEPGFRGVTTVQGHVDHDFHVKTAVPRPQYQGQVIEGEVREVKQLTTRVPSKKWTNEYNREYMRERMRAKRAQNKHQTDTNQGEGNQPIPTRESPPISAPKEVSPPLIIEDYGEQFNEQFGDIAERMKKLNHGEGRG